MSKLSFAAAEVPFGRSGTTIKGGGVWQILVKEFMESGLTSAKVNIGERDFKQAYASLAHAIKVLELREAVRAVRRNSVGSVYLERLDIPSQVYR
jgi:hypothetical protein